LTILIIDDIDNRAIARGAPLGLVTKKMTLEED
jgi:hypothetical protein